MGRESSARNYHKKRVTDEVELEKRPKIAKNGSSSLREESLLEEVSKDAEVRGLDENKTESEPRSKIKDRPSNLLEECLPEEVSDDAEVGGTD